MARDGERGILSVSRRAWRGKKDPPGGREKNAYFLTQVHGMVNGSQGSDESAP